MIRAQILAFSLLAVPAGAQTPPSRPLQPLVEAAADDLALSVLPLPSSSRSSLEDRVPRSHVLTDPDYYTWGGGAIAGDDGRYHLFYSRWPRRLGFYAWLTHSEVARAVAERPEGPYRHVETVLRSRGPGHWDRTTAHNPKIKRFGDRYYLYYCSTDGDVPETELERVARDRPVKEWYVLRNAQRTGVAVADALTGPWTRSEKPIVQPSGPITKLTVNPAVAQGPDGRFFMIVKGDRPGSRLRNQALATAVDPRGPFDVQPRPVIDSFDTEDASMWYDAKRRRFYAVYHAHTHIGMLTSADGYQWGPARQARLMEKRVAFDEGEDWVPDRLERPFVMLDDAGQPAFLFVAAKRGDDAVNLAVPLRVGDAAGVVAGAGGGLRWTRPAHWEQQPDRTLRLVTFVPAGRDDVEIYVATLAGAAGGVAANVNRWRAQMGQEPLTEAQIESLSRVPMLDRQAHLLDVEEKPSGREGATEPGRRLVGVVCPQDTDTLFIKLIGAPAAVQAEKEHFLAFCRSLSR